MEKYIEHKANFFERLFFFAITVLAAQLAFFGTFISDGHDPGLFDWLQIAAIAFTTVCLLTIRRHLEYWFQMLKTEEIKNDR